MIKWLKYWRRDDVLLKVDQHVSPTKYHAAIHRSIKEKADHNKNESQCFFMAVIICTVATPLFVTLGEGLFWGKIVPATLSSLAAIGTSWLQIRKPQKLWALYRRTQRALEREMAHFNFELHDYRQNSEKDSLLAKRVSEIAWRVHEEWEGLVPDSDNLPTASSPSPSSKPV